jgi:hypothetical protein
MVDVESRHFVSEENINYKCTVFFRVTDSINHENYQISVLIIEKPPCNSNKKKRTRIYKVEVFWVVTPCSVVLGYQRYRPLFYPFTTLDGVTTQKTSTWNIKAMKALKLTTLCAHQWLGISSRLPGKYSMRQEEGGKYTNVAYLLTPWCRILF